jgi:GPH family glycoside/pentoside/hexuronide:cation symporter
MHQSLHPAQSGQSLPTYTKVLYGLGYVPDVIMNNIVGVLAMMIYNVELGVPATWIGLALSLPRLWEAFTDPYIGNLSDNARTRWGRRRPFIVAGTVLAGILCAFMWMPPRSLGHGGLLAFFLILSILYFTAYAVYSVPYLALGLELTSNDSDRTSLMGFRAAAVPFAYIAIMPWVPVLVTNGWLGSTPVESVRIIGVAMGVLIAILGVLAAVTCRERSGSGKPEGAHTGVVAGFKQCIKNGPFLMVAGIVSLTVIGFCVATGLVYYLNLTVVFPGGTLAQKEAATKLASICMVVSNLCGMAFCPMVNPLAQRIGRKRLLLIGFGGLIGAFLLSPMLFSKSLPYLQLVFHTVVTLSVSCVWVLTLPMLGDVCDIDQIQNGTRREGVFTAMFNWGIKAAIASCSLLLGIIIDFSGFNAELPQQSHFTVTALFVACALVPLPFLLACVYMTIKFPLSPERIAELRQSKEAMAAGG